MIDGIVSGGSVQVLGFGVVLLGFLETADVQVTVTDAVVGICQCGRVFAFLQLDKVAETVLCRRIVFLVESDVAQVIVGKGKHFRIPLPGE